MCYRTQINEKIEVISKRFNARVENAENLTLGDDINGFAHQATPIIINGSPTIIQSEFYWGLIPSWCNDDSIRKNTLNARIETIEEKPAFRNVIDNRCLVIATGYYEWRWIDEKGKVKEKFEIHSAENEIFTFAGIYSKWRNPANGLELNTYSIITTQANEKMSYIHNIKKRMPLILKQKDELDWLNGNHPIADYAFPNYDADIIAFPVKN